MFNGVDSVKREIFLSLMPSIGLIRVKNVNLRRLKKMNIMYDQSLFINNLSDVVHCYE